MNSVFDYQPYMCKVDATIAISSTTTGAIDLGGTSLVGLQLPASLDATSLSFTVATAIDGTYQTLIESSGSALSATVSAGKYLIVDPADFAGIRYMKIVSNATESAARTIECITRPV